METSRPSFQRYLRSPSNDVRPVRVESIANMLEAPQISHEEEELAANNGSKPLAQTRRRQELDFVKEEIVTKSPRLSKRPTSRHFFSNLTSLLCLLALNILINPTLGAFISFQNCLSDNYRNSQPLALQFVPLYVDASFNTTDPAHTLVVTVYGNVTGSYTNETLPPPNSTDWADPNFTTGKIEDLPAPKTTYTTLYEKVNVLTYETYSQKFQFSPKLDNGTLPLGPSFTANASNPYDFPSFSLSNSFYSSYAFASMTSTFLIIDGDTPKNTTLGCISAEITPDLGSSLDGVLTFIPLAVLVLVGAATAVAGLYSPWGTTDLFKWSTNYGRDADLLRLVTPGFGDCLQYIQFVVLTGGLTLSYPGFYQPVISKVSWSTLMFNQSFVTKGPGFQSLIDGIYATNGTYGLDNLRQLVGMSDASDIWAGMAIWLLVVLGVVLASIQLLFAIRWAHRQFSGVQEEDLRAKNMPFSVGNIIRVVFSYFLLPIVALSMFQLVIAGNSPIFTVALAAIMLVAVIGFAGWLFYVVASTRPRSYLFDDLPTVLLYGSLYNTYSDNAAPFALVPVLITFIRGIAIGAVQPSGIAQIVILAICEVITILTLHAFRPFHSPTSMNAYHTFFAAVRFTSILLMVAFAPSLGVTDGPKGWIGYAILLLHAIVLIFGFLLNALQTVVEVVARLAGVGVDDNKGFAKVFGMRQLSRRLPRANAGSRQSQLSNSAMLSDRKSPQMMNGAMRSQSTGSGAILLDGPRGMGTHSKTNSIDQSAIAPNMVDSGTSSYGPTTPGEASAFSFLPSAAGSGRGMGRGTLAKLTTAETADPYYRPPRFRRPTLEAYSPGARSRNSWTSGDLTSRRLSRADSATATDGPDPFEGPSVSGRATPEPSSIHQSLGMDSINDRRAKTDYTTREVDFYYGVRGPALNANQPSRKLRTGPVDPTNPVTLASGWFKNLLGGKTKEKGKGFEVVRSSRMPPGMDPRNRAGAETPPEGIPIAATGAVRRDLDDDEPTIVGTGKGKEPQANDPILPRHNDASENSDVEGDDEEFEMAHISDVPPTLPGLDVGDPLKMPSRLPSKASSKPISSKPASSTEDDDDDDDFDFAIPRKSSRRLSGVVYGVGQNHGSDKQRASSEIPLISFGEPTSALDSITRNDKHTSIGRVQNHSIQTITPDHNSGVNLLGSSAEIHSGRASGSSRQSYDNN